MAYSMDLRERVVKAVEAGERVATVARRFSVSWPTVKDWQQRARRGALAPDKPGPKKPLKLTEADDEVMRQQVNADPGITAEALIPMLSVTVANSTVSRRLIRLGLSLKKVAQARRTTTAGGGGSTDGVQGRARVGVA